MKLFSKLFKSKPKATFQTQLGLFTLLYGRERKNLWSNNSGEMLLSVHGSATEPNAGQLKFLENLHTEINELDEGITKLFIREFRDAGQFIDFTKWGDRFKIVAVEIMLLFKQETYWNITFEDKKEPYTHFTLSIEGGKLIDLSVDI